MTQVLVIGAGHAGVQLADSLREAGFTGPVTLLAEEETLPYQRPPVSKDLLAGPGAYPLRGEQFYRDANVTLLPGRRALSIERTRRVVTTVDGAVYPYDHLVLATGSRPRALGLPGWPDVGQLHTAADADQVRNALDGAGSLLVVGAGFIGLELAAAAAHRGLPTTVVAADDRVLARAVSPEASAAVAATHTAAGTTLRLGCPINGLVRDGSRVTGVVLGDGEHLWAQLVVAGVGVIPNDELAADCGLATDGGVLVDATLTTSDPQISAIGDCARFRSPYANAPVRLESVQNATDQARHVARRLASGAPATYDDVPWFWSVQGSLRLTIAGLFTPGLDVVRRGGGAAFSLYGFDSGRLVCVESFNRTADHQVARRMLAHDRRPTHAQVSDPTVDLRGFAQAAETVS